MLSVESVMVNRILFLSAGFIVSFGIFTDTAVADPQPLSPANLTNGVQLDTSVNVPAGNPTYPVSFSFGSGGGFTTTIDATNTVMWCVDAQEDISPPTTYNADIVEVSQIGANANDVRYGNVGAWQLSLPGDNTAQERYEMAAYLVSLYPGVPAGPTQPQTAGDRELQTAIWEIMWNGSSSESGITFSQIQSDGANAANVTADIQAAQTFVNNLANASFFNNYAVVSGGANANGLLTPGIQTYIVPLSAVPEPTSVILLGSVVAGVFALKRRAQLKRIRKIN
jgi:hypothetical protein